VKLGEKEKEEKAKARKGQMKKLQF